MAEKTRAGIVRVSLRSLEEAWNFPPGHRIERIQFNIEDSHSRTVKILVSGPDLPVVTEGEPIPEVMIILEDGKARFEK